MSTEFQPVDPRIPFYIPENWVQPTAGSSSGSFVTFPVTQTANILFPGSISCSNLQSFAPSATMNLFNNSTSGNIQFANNFGYTGGIVINADTTSPVAGKTIIGDSARALVAPLLETNVLQGNGLSFVDVESDLNVNTGYAVYTNSLQRVSGKNLNIGTDILDVTINIGTAVGSDDIINIGTGMTSVGNVNLGGTLGTTNAKNLESQFIGCKDDFTLDLGTFAGRAQPINIGTKMTGGNINLGGATTQTTARKLLVDTLNPVSTLLEVGTTNQRIDIGRVASRTTPIDIGNLGLGDGTTMGSIFIGAGANSVTSSISLGSSSLHDNFIRGATLRLNDGANAVSTIIGNSFAGNTVTVNAPITFNAALKTNSIVLVSGTELSLPASTTTAPALGDTSARVVTSQWVANEGFPKKSAINLFSAKNEFSDVIRVNDIAGYNTPNININQAVCSAPTTLDGSDRVVTSQWVRDQGFVSNVTGYARYDATVPTASFDYRNEFKAGIKTSEIELYTAGGITALTLPTTIKTNTIELVSGSTLTLPNILTNSIGLVSGTTLALPAATTTTPAIPNNTTLVPTTAWVTTTITNAINAITGFATYAGTTAFTALQTFNAGVTINSANPLTITASNRAETYNAGGSSTVSRFVGATTGTSASSMSFSRRSVSGSGFNSPFQIFSQTNAGGFIFSTQYMEIIVSGIISRSSGGNNFFTTKASFVVSNRLGDTHIPSFTYNTQYSSTSQNVFFSTQTPSVYEINLRVEFDTAFVTRQDYYATLITYPSMSTSGVNTNFRIAVP